LAVSGCCVGADGFFYGVNKGRDVIAFHPDFAPHMERLARVTEGLLAEQKATERYKRVAAKLARKGIALEPKT
jgi:hypothetical protein